MSLVVVGGQSRNVGKTSVVAGFISAFASLNWMAVKITPHQHTLAPEQRFVITEEPDRAGPKDTSRYLAAGARRALLVESRPDAMKEAVDAVLERVAGSENVIIESNAVVDFLRPDIYLLVLDPSVSDFKESARRLLERADALITTEAPVPEQFAPGGKPMFQVAPPRYVSPELLKFVGERIRTN